jgi:ubiquitin C-terminal hydrolase
LKPKANQYLHLAAQFILNRLESPNVNYLAQTLHRIFLNNHEHCPFYARQSREDLPEQYAKQYLPGGTNTSVGTSASEIDTTNMTFEQLDAAWKGATNFVRFTRGERNTSPLYFVNINFFGASGGFRRIYELIEDTKSLSLFTLKLHVKVICAMRFGLSLAFMKVFLPPFVDLVCKRLLEWFGVNLKPDLKTHYNDTIEFLISMMNEIMSEEHAIQRMDTYTLDGCLAMFNTENLEKRLRGLRDVKTLIDRTQKNEERRFAAIGKFFTGPSIQDEEEEKKKKRQPRIPAKVILSWLEKNAFLDLFFQMLKSHIEILRQGTPILIFVAQQGQLKIEHLDGIWSMAANMHEHDKRILNSSLVAIVPHLPPSHLDHLITQISDSPIQSIDEQVVDLIVSLTTLSVAADTKHKWNGLELLWKLCQDPEIPSNVESSKSTAGVDADAASSTSTATSTISAATGGNAASSPTTAVAVVAATKKRTKKGGKDENVIVAIEPLLAHKAFTKLCELLTTEECTPQRATYMERCFNNLDEGRSVSLSIEILRKCIDAYPSRRRKKAVTDMESKKKLINLIFEDFKFYKTEATKIGETLQASAASSNISSSLSVPSGGGVNANPSLTPPTPGKKQRRKSGSIEEGKEAKGSSDSTPIISRPGTPSSLAGSSSQVPNNNVASATPIMFDINTMLVLGRPHLENVRQRLFFLEYVISNAALTMRMEQVDLLWDLFITQALSSAEREVAFGWLERASSNASGDVVILSEQQLQHLFTDKMLTMSGSAITTAGYQLFERYFCRINDRQGKVKFAEEKNDKSIGLVSPDAVGLDKLWEIALDNEDKEVSAAAISCLNQLHLNLENFMNRAKAIKIRETYVQNALDKLTQGSSDEESSGRLERCLNLLMECVMDFEELKGESAVPSSSAASGGLLSGWVFGDVFGGSKRAGKNGGAVTIKVFLKSPGKSPQRLVLNSLTTIRSIAEKAAELFNFDIYDTLKLTLEDDKDRELRDLDKTLGESKVPDDSTIVVRKTLEAIEGGQNQEGPSVFAAMLQALTLSVGGVGATTDQMRQIIQRAENALKSQTAAVANGNASASKGLAVGGAKTGSDSLPSSSSSSTFEPMFAPIHRASLYREIRLGDDKSRELHPARILCSPAYFGKLYNLLGTANDELGEPLWELLTMLPKSDQTLLELSKISTKQHVVASFPLDRPFQMLYNLQLLESLLTKAMAPTDHPIAPVGGLPLLLDETWISSLLNAELLEHLLDKFFSVKISSLKKSTATIKLLPQLLRIINMLSLEVSKDDKNLASRLSSLNLSRSLSTHSQRNPHQGKYRLSKRRDHFHTSDPEQGAVFETFIDDFVSRLLRLTTALSSSSSLSSNSTTNIHMEDEALTVQEALVLLVPLVTSSTASLDSFLGSTGFRAWLIGLILKSPSIKMRECAVRAISELVAFTSLNNPSSKSETQTSLVLLEMLLPAQDDSLDSYASSCDEFFLALEILLRDVAATPYFQKKEKKDKSSSNKTELIPIAHPVLLDLVKQMIVKIESRPVVEKFAAPGNEDKILIGFMQLVYSIVYRDGASVAGKKSRAPLYKSSCRSLVNELFHMCLFAIPTAQRRGPDAPPKCKTKASRAIAYKLLTELCSHCDRNLNAVLRLLQEQVQSIDMGGDYTFFPGRNEKSNTGYVGLQNQGATCYMNATMQQLYMVNEFRQGVLGSLDQSFASPIDSVLKLPPEKKKQGGPKPFYDDSDDNSSDEEAPIDWTVETATQKLQKESVLFQLQRMFAYLQEGERRSFDTRPFCYSYKDFEGKPVNTSQQMDANEYFNRLFDSIEGKLAGSHQATLLKDIFGGKYANQLLGTGSECSHRRESTEPFFSISVDIKHKTTLQDSLKSFTEGEVLGGDNKPECPKCSKNVDTLKRCLMHTLPPILVVHLKRFEFHYEQMRHYKLNSSCSFPMELDMEPYMRESHAAKENAKSKASGQVQEEGDVTAAADDGDEALAVNPSSDDQQETLSDLINLAQARKAAGYYDYELAGVVVHVGSSDAGHYYSFIKERPASLPPGRVRDATVGNKWYEFNDSYVTEFDPAKIPLECYGGEDEVMEFADETRTTKRAVKRPRTNNAYILIYQRKTLSSDAGPSAESSSSTSLNGNGTSSLNASGVKPNSRTHSRNPSTNGIPNNDDKTNDEVEELNERSLTDSRKSMPIPKRIITDIATTESKSSINKKKGENSSIEDLSSSSSIEKESGKEKKSVPIVHLNGTPAENNDSENVVSINKKSSEEESGEESSSAAAPSPNASISTDLSSPTLDSAVITTTNVDSSNIVKIPGANEIFESIYEENRLFILRKHLFDPEYFNFVWSIVNANLPSLPPRTLDEIRRDREETQRKADVSRMFRERRELERETNSYPSPYVPRMGMIVQNMPPPPGPRQLVAGSGPNAIKLEVRAMNHTPTSLKQEEARLAKERKEEEARRAKEKPLDADEQRLEQERKMDAAEKAAKDKKAAAKAERKAGSTPGASPAVPTKGSKAGKAPTDGKSAASFATNAPATSSIAGSDSPSNTSKKSTKKVSTPSTSKKSTEKEGENVVETKPNDPSSVATSKDSTTPSSTPTTSKKSKKRASSNRSSTPDTTSKEEAEEADLSSSSASSVKADLTNFALDFIKNIYVHARETPLLNLWLTTLYRLYASNLTKAQQLLRNFIEDPADLAHMLFHLTSEKARNCHAQMIVAAMRALSNQEKKSYLQTAKTLSEGKPMKWSSGSYCVWFLEEMWKLAKVARRNHFDGFFYVFAQFASFGPEERYYLLKRGFLQDIITFALYFEPAAAHSRCLNTPRQAATEMFNLADLLSTLLLACDSEASEEQPPSSLHPENPHELTEKEHPAALGFLLSNLLMREDINSHAYGRIVCHFAWENEEMSKFLLGNITRGILESTLPSQSRGFLDVLCYVVKNLEDSMQSKRFDMIIEAFPKWLGRYKNVRRAGVERVIQSFFIMASLHPLMRQKVMSMKSQINSYIEGAGYRII